MALTPRMTPQTDAMLVPVVQVMESPDEQDGIAEDPDAAFDRALAETESCPMLLDLVAESGARIAVTLSAPCHAAEAVVLDHAGLSVTSQTSATGSLYAVLPALSEEASVVVIFADGSMVEAQVTVPGAGLVGQVKARW